MNRILKLLAVLVLPTLLGACMGTEQFSGCTKSGRVCVEGVTTGSSVDGKRVTAWGTTTPQGTSYAQETSTPLGGELAKIAVGSIVPAVINAGAGMAIANKQSCGGKGCAAGGGTQINVVAQSDSTAVNHNQGTVTVSGLCPNQPGGVCPLGAGM